LLLHNEYFTITRQILEACLDFSIFFTTFAIIFLAELGDKTQLTAMALAVRFPWFKTFIGIAAAFTILNVFAVVLGKVLFSLLPLFWIKQVSAALFLFFGVTTLLSKESGDDEPEKEGASARGAIATSFIMILMAELGDKTQLVTASLAAQHDAPFEVFAGSTLALWAVSLVGIFAGRQLIRFIPLSYIHKGAGCLFILFGAVISYQAFAGH
jgi:putative Ca2+/H+ antiporter (TMEM165/GDT1 family)